MTLDGRIGVLVERSEVLAGILFHNCQVNAGKS